MSENKELEWWKNYTVNCNLIDEQDFLYTLRAITVSD